MRLRITAHLDYHADRPTDMLLQIGAATLPDQQVQERSLTIVESDHIVATPGEAEIGERLWIRASGRIVIDYSATAVVDRPDLDLATLDAVPLHELPAETIPYLMASRYCPSDRFETFVAGEFAGKRGAQVVAMRDWIGRKLTYAAGVSTSETTAADTFVDRRGVCRDYAHLLITFARAAGIPARFASVYAPGVTPPDFHAVAQVFLGGDWHLIDATAMASPSSIAIIGVGRDAGDVAFLSAFGTLALHRQSVAVVQSDAP